MKYTYIFPSILIALEMEDKRKRTADRLVRKNGYQLILLLAAISLLILFTHYVFPVMGNSIVKDNSLLQGIDLMIIVLNVLLRVMVNIKVVMELLGDLNVK